MFISELFLNEISDELRRSYLDRAGKHVDRRMNHMARVRDRLNKGYEIYHANRPAGSGQIVDRFEADTPALARQYYEKFIQNYDSDVDFDLELRRATGIIEEAFDQSYPITWEKSDADESVDALARLPDGSNLSIMFNQDLDDEGEGIYSVEFWRNNSQEVTGEGDQQRVFATVLSAIQQFVEKRNPAQLYFSADKDSGNSRSNLYTRLVQRYARAMGYEADVSDFAGSTTYKLHKLYEKAVTEARIPSAIEEFLDSLSPDDVGVEDFGRYRVHFEGFTDDCKSSKDYRRNPDAVYDQVFADFIAREGGRKPLVQDMTGDEEYPILYAIFRTPKAVSEVTMVPTVAKGKREHLDVMPNEGRPIPKGEESDYLGDLVAEMGDGYQLWSWTDRGTVTYFVFDTRTRTCQLGTTGRPYTSHRDSFVVQGVYSGPKNRYRAADLYAFLIINRGLTLVSDNKQSEGGYKVWQELEQRYGREINIHGFDTKTDQGVNVTTKDEPETHVDRETIKRAGPQMKKELGSISRDLRFVASAR